MATVKHVGFSPIPEQSIHWTQEAGIKLTVFDQQESRRLAEARAACIRHALRKLRHEVGLFNAVDAGCGVGFFSNVLSESGLEVLGFDAREENVCEARKRFPAIPFARANVEDRGILQLGRFDLVLCFGLLYHLENPLQAIRNLSGLTEKCLLLESMCLPDEKAVMMLRNEAHQEDQSLSSVAWYPSETSLVKMLYCAGYKSVYRVLSLPDHENFRETMDHARRRTVLLASTVPIDVAGYRLIPETREEEDPWAKRPITPATLRQRVARFLSRPSRSKYITLANRARKIFPGLPIPLRLPFGAWWLAKGGALDHDLLYGGFERAEMEFVRKLLRPGMTVVDIGAHHGIYTLMASKRVGRRGRVVAIEPSSRERARLEKHSRLNRCSNVETVGCAAGEDPGEKDFYLVEGFEDGFNSLRLPAIDAPVKTTQVGVRRLDDILSELEVLKVDFIKLDAEGAELAVLYGALKLLNSKSRPAMLVEVQDARTAPWGYRAQEILRFLICLDYKWFAIREEGTLLPVSCQLETYDANLVALPSERVEEFLGLLEQE